MTDPVTLTADDPEQGWPPFLEWLVAHGFDPDRVTELTIEGDEITATVRDVPTVIVSGSIVCSVVRVPLQFPAPRWREAHA